jgi:hypothetical protein
MCAACEKKIEHMGVKVCIHRRCSIHARKGAWIHGMYYHHVHGRGQRCLDVVMFILLSMSTGESVHTQTWLITDLLYITNTRIQQTSQRELDLGLEERQYRLDNMLARAGI